MTGISIANPDIGPDAYDRVHAILESGQLADGPEVRQFESAFARYCGADHGVATTNGTTALVTALKALDIGDGDAVVTTPFSFVASANAIRLAGATPVFADINPETYTLDPDAVERVVRQRSDVVGLLPVHLYGLPADMDRLLEIAAAHDLVVLEDACQAHGAVIDGQPVGRFGDAACFSFYPTKNMTTGEGGMITTTRDDIAERAASHINHGRDVSGDRGYDHVRLGNNHRLTSLAAAIGRSQLERLPEFTHARQANAATYDERLADLPLETPSVPNGMEHVYHQYTISTDERDALASWLADRDIGTGIYYPTPIHQQPAYDSVSTAASSHPHAEAAARRVLSLPVHPNLSDDELETVIEAITAFYDHQ
ncbi:DegT/DnrJ/EryC1/StrS family aminotransferase [Natronosalvus hydrolyticus]